MVENADRPAEDQEYEHGHDVYTVANIITVLRLILVPIAFNVLISDKGNVLAFALFALAASTDWLDGQIARRTGTVTEIGKAIDPLVDRLLIAAGVLGLYIEHRIPLWMVIILVARDGLLLAGAAYLARKQVRRIPVTFIGKTTTLLLLFGFSGMILAWPSVPGLGLFESAAFPGWGSAPAIAWIWFVYIGIVTSMITAAGYVTAAVKAVFTHKG